VDSYDSRTGLVDETISGPLNKRLGLALQKIALKTKKKNRDKKIKMLSWVVVNYENLLLRRKHDEALEIVKSLEKGQIPSFEVLTPLPTMIGGDNVVASNHNQRLTDAAGSLQDIFVPKLYSCTAARVAAEAGAFIIGVGVGAQILKCTLTNGTDWLYLRPEIMARAATFGAKVTLSSETVKIGDSKERYKPLRFGLASADIAQPRGVSFDSPEYLFLWNRIGLGHGAVNDSVFEETYQHESASDLSSHSFGLFGATGESWRVSFGPGIRIRKRMPPNFAEALFRGVTLHKNETVQVQK
jgi:hypothetical protein